MQHYSPAITTRIHDADMFAAAFVRGLEHPAVRKVLDGQYDRADVPLPVRVPISELLGAGGERYCSGFRLVGDDVARALADRTAWLAGERRADLAEPQAERIRTFDGGTMEFRFCHNRMWNGYELCVWYPMPPGEPGDGEWRWLPEPYWRDDPDAPFATMLGVIDTYCHPEAHDSAFDELRELARRHEPPERIRRFRAELRRTLSGDRGGLRPRAVLAAAHYDDGNDEAYLATLWHRLYPDEPVPAPSPVPAHDAG